MKSTLYSRIILRVGTRVPKFITIVVGSNILYLNTLPLCHCIDVIITVGNWGGGGRGWAGCIFCRTLLFLSMNCNIYVERLERLRPAIINTCTTMLWILLLDL